MLDQIDAGAGDAENAWERFVEAFASGQLSIFDMIKEASLREGDYEGFVAMFRAFLMLRRDPRILNRFLAETVRETEKAIGKPAINQAERVVRSKDGPRRFQKLCEVRADICRGEASFITGKTFDESLRQYLDLIAHVEHLWDDACRLYREKHFPLSTFVSILTIEEVGKLGRLWNDLLKWDRPPKLDKGELGLLGKDHRKKHFVSVMAGAVINARLDRILGLRKIQELLRDAESGKLERLRQSCLYIDMVDGKVVMPEEVIAPDTARFFAVLAGELWAETLGHFPWDFKKMINKVTAFEIELGFKKSDVER
jgi:AbiV family abortive infection protein